MNQKSEMSAFKGKIYKHGVIVAILAQLISLIFLGWRPQFTYGLALGTAIAIVNFTILAFLTGRTVDGKSGKWTLVLSYFIRMGIYAYSFYVCIKISNVCGLGALIGFLTLKIAIYYLYGFKPKFSKSSAEGKKLNNLDEDGWPEPEGKHWWSKLFKSAWDEDPGEREEPAEAGNNNEKEE